MDNVIRYNNCYDVIFGIMPDKHISIDIYHNGSYRQNKKYPILFFHKDNDSDTPVSMIQSAAYKPYIATLIYGKTLYVSPDSKIPRDLLRASDYKITYSPDKADYIVIPRPEGSDIYCNPSFLVRDTATNNVYLCNIENNCHGYEPDIDALIKRLVSEDDSIQDGTCLEYEGNANYKMHVWKTQGGTEYEDIYRHGTSNKYILDCDLPLTPANTVSVETLDMWRRLAVSDMNMFEKAILNSNAREYPFTIWNFLNFDNDIRYRSQPTKIKWLMENMGINDRYWPTNVMIFPKDLQMISEYIMYRLGTSEGGGFISYKRFDEIPYQFRNIIRQKFCVAPVKIDHPISYNEITSLSRNS